MHFRGSLWLALFFEKDDLSPAEGESPSHEVAMAGSGLGRGIMKKVQVDLLNTERVSGANRPKGGLANLSL